MLEDYGKKVLAGVVVLAVFAGVLFLADKRQVFVGPERLYLDAGKEMPTDYFYLHEYKQSLGEKQPVPDRPDYTTILYGGIVKAPPSLKDGQYRVELKNNNWDNISILLGRGDEGLELQTPTDGYFLGNIRHQGIKVSKLGGLLEPGKQVLFEFYTTYSGEWLDAEKGCSDPRSFDFCSARLERIERSVSLNKKQNLEEVIKKGGAGLELYYPKAVLIGELPEQL